MQGGGGRIQRNLIPPNMNIEVKRQRPRSVEKYERGESSRYAHNVYGLIGYHKPTLPEDSMFEIMRYLVPGSHARILSHIRRGKTYEEAKYYESKRRK